MREIEFRGYSKRFARWVVGFLIADNKIREFGIRDKGHDVLCVGQYTGIKDKNGIKIYEGDILRNSRNDLFVVRYICGGFDCEPIKEFYKQPKISWNTLGELQNASWVEDNNEVIGNIYNNPNLLPMEANNEE